MLGIGYGFFVRVASDGNRCILHPAEITSIVSDVFTADLKEGGLDLGVGAEFLVYYEIRQKFVKQSARVESVSEDEDVAAITFVTIGDPVSAENRQEFRVSTVMNGLYCSIADETSCVTVDVSAKGFAALAKAKHAIGEIVDVDLRYEGRRFAGRVCVQSIKKRGEDRYRYGLRCVEDKNAKSNLGQGLWQISMALQRQQLRRIAGTR